MTRPRSIAIFEIAYLAALLIAVASPFLMWPALTADIAERAHVGPGAAGTVNGVLIAGILIAAALGLLLWWLVARRGSNVARWLAVLVLGYGLVSTAMGLAEATDPFDLLRALSLLGMICDAVGLAALFRPDANAWFAADPEPLA